MDKTGYIVLGLVGVLIVGMLVLYSGSSTELYFSDASPVLYFYSETCPHCIAMKPILTQLGSEGFRVKPMAIESHSLESSQYNVEGTPTWVSSSNSDKLVGEVSIDELRAFLLRNNAKIA